MLQSLEDIFNAVRRVSTSTSHLTTTPALSPPTSTSLVPPSESFALVATHTPSTGRGGGRDHGHGHSDHGHGGSHNSYPPCAHCGQQNHPSNKCYQKFRYPLGWSTTHSVATIDVLVPSPPTDLSPKPEGIGYLESGGI